jgi:phosphatidate cytidylyltransferase
MEEQQAGTTSKSTEVHSIRSKPELTQRMITGFSGAILIVVCLSFSEWGFLFIYFGLTLLLLQEFYKLWEHHDMRPMRYYGLISGLLMVLVSFLIARGTLSPKFYFILFPHFSIAFLIKLYEKDASRTFEGLGIYFLGQVYIALPMSLLSFAVFDGGVYRAGMSVAIMLFLWANETGAYFVGKAFGKHKLFERISPKKSWEGSIGGAVLCFYICLLFIFSYYGRSYHPLQWLSVALAMVLAANFGDLVESMLKRGFELKDSGQAIPGHGGFLDRFDGLIYSGPFIAAILEVF